MYCNLSLPFLWLMYCNFSAKCCEISIFFSVTCHMQVSSKCPKNQILFTTNIAFSCSKIWDVFHLRYHLTLIFTFFFLFFSDIYLKLHLKVFVQPCHKVRRSWLLLSKFLKKKREIAHRTTMCHLGRFSFPLKNSPEPPTPPPPNVFFCLYLSNDYA